MSNFTICDDDDNVKSYRLTAYNITILNESKVLITFESGNYCVNYELNIDDRYKTVDNIKEHLDKLIYKVLSMDGELIIDEYFKRMYVSIGYETDIEIENGQFTCTSFSK